MFKLLIILCTIYLAFGGLIIDNNNNNSNSDYEFTGKSWVVLCSGSSGWSDYAHQANVYHAYQTFRARGIPEENIIIFHYDNIANSTSNPTPGVVINSPTGPNVYHNIPKHYTGKDVNPETFLKVLKGDKDLESQGKPVLKSGPNDHVFVQFTDHGAPGMVMFQSNPLHAQDLNDALKYMHDKQMFAKLVFYIDACDPGSMFNNLLPNNINVYAVTSGKHNELTYFWWYSQKHRTFITAWFFSLFMNNTETYDLTRETLEEQYVYFANRSEVIDPSYNHGTSKSYQHASHYGDLTIGQLPASQFLGTKNINVTNDNDNYMGDDNDDDYEYHVTNGPIDPYIFMAEKRIELADNIDEKLRQVEALDRLLKSRQLIDQQFDGYVKSLGNLLPTGVGIESVVNSRLELNNNRQCYRQLVDTFHQKCIRLSKNPYLLRKMQIFLNICESIGQTFETDLAVNQLDNYCNENNNKFQEIFNLSDD